MADDEVCLHRGAMSQKRKGREGEERDAGTRGQARSVHMGGCCRIGFVRSCRGLIHITRYSFQL